MMRIRDAGANARSRAHYVSAKLVRQNRREGERRVESCHGREARSAAGYVSRSDAAKTQHSTPREHHSDPPHSHGTAIHATDHVILFSFGRNGAPVRGVRFFMSDACPDTRTACEQAGVKKLVPSFSVKCFVHFTQMFVGDVRVDLRGRDVRMPEERLYRSEVRTVLQKVGSE